MSAVDLVTARIAAAQALLDPEEGTKFYPYDDATGLRVRAPKGHLSWGRGFNLEECGSIGLFNVMERYLLEVLDDELKVLPWYGELNVARQSACLDIAYNDGEAGLLDFHLMIAAFERQDWAEAAKQCHVENPALAGRYAALAKIILTGITV
jgi:GH24 family phage-related lysozyme (muramidase)